MLRLPPRRTATERGVVAVAAVVVSMVSEHAAAGGEMKPNGIAAMLRSAFARRAPALAADVSDPDLYALAQLSVDWVWDSTRAGPDPDPYERCRVLPGAAQ